MVVAYPRSVLLHLEHLFRHRALTLELARREVLDRYAGQLFGLLWVLGHPLVLVAVFVFLFQGVLALRLDDSRALPLDYTTYLLSSMIPWLAFQEVLGKAPLTMHAHSALVKQVVFPIEVLPVKTVLASLATQLVGTGCLLAWVYYRHRLVPWTYLLLPALWTCQFLAMVGVCLILAAVGAYFRDLKDFVQVFNTVGIYLMPTVYLPEWVPELFRPYLNWNPFSHLAWCYQDACYFGRFEHPWSWLLFPLLSLLVFELGNRLFRQLKVCFGSVL